MGRQAVARDAGLGVHHGLEAILRAVGLVADHDDVPARGNRLQPLPGHLGLERLDGGEEDAARHLFG